MSPKGINEAGYVSVVQLTDSHLFADQDARLLGLDTFASLEAVIGLALAEVPVMDLVLATGDITQDATPAAYSRFMDAVGRLPAACHWIPGNHDDAELMRELGDASGFSRPWIDSGNWRIVLLDSSIAGAVPGYLRDDQLSILSEAIESAGERHLMVCLHHHPVDIGVDWMQPLGLRNASQFLEVLKGREQVKAVLWGHIHQQLDQQLGNVRMLATPSTCIQFAANSSDFATDDQQPGYRWLRLYDDGRIDTGISRLAPGRFIPDQGATGY